MNDYRARRAEPFRRDFICTKLRQLHRLEKHDSEDEKYETEQNTCKYGNFTQKMTKIGKSGQNTANKGILDLPKGRPDSPLQIGSFLSQVW